MPKPTIDFDNEFERHYQIEKLCTLPPSHFRGLFLLTEAYIKDHIDEVTTRIRKYRDPKWRAIAAEFVQQWGQYIWSPTREGILQPGEELIISDDEDVKKESKGETPRIVTPQTNVKIEEDEAKDFDGDAEMADNEAEPKKEEIKDEDPPLKRKKPGPGRPPKDGKERIRPAYYEEKAAMNTKLRKDRHTVWRLEDALVYPDDVDAIAYLVFNMLKLEASKGRKTGHAFQKRFLSGKGKSAEPGDAHPALTDDEEFIEYTPAPSGKKNIKRPKIVESTEADPLGKEESVSPVAKKVPLAKKKKTTGTTKKKNPGRPTVAQKRKEAMVEAAGAEQNALSKLNYLGRPAENVVKTPAPQENSQDVIALETVPVKNVRKPEAPKLPEPKEKRAPSAYFLESDDDEGMAINEPFVTFNKGSHSDRHDNDSNPDSTSDLTLPPKFPGLQYHLPSMTDSSPAFKNPTPHLPSGIAPQPPSAEYLADKARRLAEAKRANEEKMRWIGVGVDPNDMPTRIPAGKSKRITTWKAAHSVGGGSIRTRPNGTDMNGDSSNSTPASGNGVGLHSAGQSVANSPDHRPRTNYFLDDDEEMADESMGGMDGAGDDGPREKPPTENEKMLARFKARKDAANAALSPKKSQSTTPIRKKAHSPSKAEPGSAFKSKSSLLRKETKSGDRATTDIESDGDEEKKPLVSLLYKFKVTISPDLFDKPDKAIADAHSLAHKQAPTPQLNLSGEDLSWVAFLSGMAQNSDEDERKALNRAETVTISILKDGGESYKMRIKQAYSEEKVEEIWKQVLNRNGKAAVDMHRKGVECERTSWGFNGELEECTIAIDLNFD